MFKGNNQFVSVGLGATKVTIFVAVVLKTQKGIKLSMSVVGCRKKCKRREIPKRPRLKDFKSTGTVR